MPNIQMRERNATNDAWNDLYPITKAELVDSDYRTYRLNKDSEGVFTRVEKRRKDGTLAVASVLSGGTLPNYTTKTVTYYKADGTSLIKTETFTLSYDTDGVLISEV